MLIDRFERQLGLAYHGASHHAAALCDTLIASAVVIDPALATKIGVDAGWAPQAITALAALPPRDPGRVAEVRDRVMNLELTLGDTAAQRNVLPRDNCFRWQHWAPVVITDWWLNT